ncbi:MAG: hypothetical protein KDA66_19355, partial [Planctomycetaceae bacterium]|nr:hypothetical protein [Planctomycetaceae bacterium]
AGGAVIADAVHIQKVGGGSASEFLKSGFEFLVNTGTTDNQNAPQVAVAANGSFVAVWASSAGSREVYMRRFATDGSPIGGETQVNTYSSNDQNAPAIAMAPDGRFVISWTSTGQDTSFDGVFAKLFDSAGNAVTGDILVNTHVADNQRFSSVSMNSSGQFVISWQSDHQDDANGVGIHAQRFDANGTPVGSEILVNSTTEGDQRFPSVALTEEGSFAVVWQSNYNAQGYEIFAQRFDANGVKEGSETQVNQYTFNDQTNATVAYSPAGRFLIAWQSTTADGSGDGVFGRLLNVSGQFDSNEFRINSETFNDQRFPSVASTANGDFVVAWHSDNQDVAGGRGVYAQLLNSAGEHVGMEIPVNSTVLGDQMNPSVGIGPSGRAVIVWESDQPEDGDAFGVFAQIFQVID